MLTTSNSLVERDISPETIPQPVQQERRSKLHVGPTLHWLNKRHSRTANMKYLLLPGEQQQHTDFLNVFDFFDVDHSGKLTIGEFYNMLKHAHISVDKKDLREFYKAVDDNNDTELDFREFKNSTFSNQANLFFSEMMKRAKSRSRSRESHSVEKNGNKSNTEESPRTFIPRTFGNLLNYLAYDSKKKDIIKFVKDDNNDLEKKFEKFSELFNLQINKDQFLERGNNRESSQVTKTHTYNTSSSFSSKGSMEYGKTDNVIRSFDSKLTPEKPIPCLTPKEESVKEPVSNKSKSKFLQEIIEISNRAEQQAKEEYLEVKRREMSTKSFTSCTPSLTHLPKPSIAPSRENLNISRASIRAPDALTPKMGTIYLDDGKTTRKSIRSNCDDFETFSNLAEQNEAHRVKHKTMPPVQERARTKKSFDMSPMNLSEKSKQKLSQTNLEKASSSPVYASPVQNFSSMLVNIFPTVANQTPSDGRGSPKQNGNSNPYFTPPSIKFVSPSSRKLPDINKDEDSPKGNQSLPRIVLSPCNANKTVGRTSSFKDAVNARLQGTDSVAPSIRIIRDNEPGQTQAEMSPYNQNKTFSHDVQGETRNLGTPKQTKASRLIRETEPSQTPVDLSPYNPNKTFSYDMHNEAKNILSPPKHTAGNRPMATTFNYYVKEKTTNPAAMAKKLKDMVDVDMYGLVGSVKPMGSEERGNGKQGVRLNRSIGKLDSLNNSGIGSRTVKRPFTIWRAHSNEPVRRNKCVWIANRV